MTRAPSLEARVASWFATTLVVLYGVIAIGIWASSYQNGRRYAVLSLKTETESVAAYVAIRGRLNAPELEQVEEEPFPIWLRVISGDDVLAATPDAPDLGPRPPETTQEVLYLRPEGATEPLLVVRHAVGGRGSRLGPDLFVEAIGDISSIRRDERLLATGLAVLGLVIIPLAAAGGRLLARRSLSPIGDLVREIGGLSGTATDRRLTVPDGAVAEVAVLADAFNGVLARLELSLETMRRFTEDASHEIRNPLSVLRTGLEVSLRRDRSAEEYRTVLRENLQEIDHLQAILEGLLALARSQGRRQIALQRERVDLGRLIQETRDRMAPVAEDRDAPIRVDLGADLALDGDPRILRLIVFNLLDNALKHGAEGEPIAVAAHRDDGRLRLTVTSSGKAIPEEQRDLVFERYYRVEGAGSRRDVGGLGLSVVRWAAESHGGQARLLDEAGRTTFEIVLPAD
jgi:signal transduction histidine kinase